MVEQLGPVMDLISNMVGGEGAEEVVVALDEDSSQEGGV